METNNVITETHPLKPFLPENTRILMCGTFPPPRIRWSVEWFYPNYINDMWRIWGYIYKGDKNWFVDTANKRFLKERIIDFCRETGLGLTDTGLEVRRLRNNASDKFLEIVKPFDLETMLKQIPLCRSIVTTGELATETLCAVIGCEPLKMGESRTVDFKGRELTLWRCPSSSRSYPKPIEWKAEYYRKVLEHENRKQSTDEQSE